MVRKGHRGCPSTERCSFQSLSEGNIYARQPTDARDSTAPAVRSEIRNSLSLRLALSLLLHVQEVIQEIWVLRKQHPSTPTTPFLCPICPRLQKSQERWLLQMKASLQSWHALLLYSTTGQKGPRGKWGSSISSQLIGIVYKILLMPWMEEGDKTNEIRLSKLCAYKERLTQILKCKNKNYLWVLVKFIMKITLIIVL